MSARRCAAALLLLACQGPLRRIETFEADSGSKPDSGSHLDAGTDGGSDSGTPDAGPGAAALDAFCAELVSATCAYRVRCALSADAGCEAHVRGDLHLYEPCLEAERASVVRGTAAFDEAGSAACLQAMREGGACRRADPLDQLEACQGLVTGTRAVDGECFSDSDCAGESYCDATAAACPSRCRAAKGAGAAAAREGECQSGLYLYGLADQPDRTCERPAALGASCDSLRANTPPQRCAAGSSCDPYGTKRCVAVVSAGAACTFDEDCVEPLVCIMGQCDRPSAVGQPCGDGRFGGVQRPCLPELFCHALPPGSPGACAPRVAEHEPCFIGTDCQPGLWCDRAGATDMGQGSCVARKPDGARCELNPFEDVCMDGSFCDFNDTQLCTAKRQTGGACLSEYECAHGFVCGAGSTCTPAWCGPGSP